LLIVGEVDDNVDPASTMQVVNALIAAKMDFELVVLLGVNHTLSGDYGEKKCRDFYVKTFYTKCKSKKVQPNSGIMPMNRNVKSNRVCEDWTVIFLQSVLKSIS